MAIAVQGTLTVFCKGGLANRLRVLVSGLALAELSSRTFRYIWPRTPTCGAAFRELFINRWPPVEDVEALDPELPRHRIEGWGFRQAVALLDDPRPDLVLGVSSWLAPTGPRWPTSHDRCATFLAALSPIEPVADHIGAFRACHFRPVMIGVHLRRGDFLRDRPDVAGNTARALTAVDRFLAEAPDAGIPLCTDDVAIDREASAPEGLAQRFAARYGDRVVSTAPRSLDRRTVEAIQDDFQLLRATQMVVGTEGSWFSRLAAFGRDVPYVLVQGRRAAMPPSTGRRA